MTKALQDNWTLFLGILLLMVSNGLLGTLLTIRGQALGFTEVTIGLMQAGYPMGALIGSVIAPKLVEKVGHIRAFGALASLCSVAAIVHLVTRDPTSWWLMRLLAGFCYPGLYVVAESWLNAKSENDMRARILSIYFVVGALGSASGSALIGLDDPDGVLLFAVTSILISVSLVPMLLANSGAPDYRAPDRLAFVQLLRISPTAMLGAMLSGALAAGLFVGLPLYGLALGMGPGQAASLVVVSTFAGAAFQFPVGWWSDQTDRRLVIACLSAGGGLVAVLLALGLWPLPVHAGVILMSGLLLPVYSICVAQANDHLTAAQIVPASGTLVLALNIGILVGALGGPSLLGLAGPGGMMLFLAALAGLTVLVALLRVAQVDAPEETGAALALAAQGVQSAGRLHPDVPVQPDKSAKSGKNAG